MQPQKILLVDDEPLVLRSMQKTLQRSGFEVETAKSCSEGLKTFENARSAGAPFDLAVVDLNMPDFDGQEASDAGLQLMTRLKEKDTALQVIVLTAYDEVNRAKEAISLGAYGYCVKGREQALLEQIQTIFQA